MAGRSGWGWYHDPKLAAKRKLTPAIQEKLTAFFEPLLQEYRTRISETVPDKSSVYLSEVYSKWRQHYFYLGSILKAEFENRRANQFDEVFARIEFVDENIFNVAYKRHNGTWFTLAKSLTLDGVFELIKNEALLQPMW